MAEAAADTSKTKVADEGGGGTTLDKVLAKLDSIAARQDALEAKNDAKSKKDGDLTLEHEGTEKVPVQGEENPPIKLDAKRRKPTTQPPTRPRSPLTRKPRLTATRTKTPRPRTSRKTTQPRKLPTPRR